LGIYKPIARRKPAGLYNSIVVWSDKVPNPVAVRYVWAGNPENANLYNYEGLPVSPFRIDAWK